MAKKINQEAKTLAIVSYITIIGLIVSLILNHEKKHAFAAFHIRQSLLLMIVAVVATFIPVVGWIINLVVLAFIILGIVYAAQGEQKLIPLLGELAQDWFKGI